MKNQKVTGFFLKIEELTKLIDEKLKKGFESKKDEYIFNENIKELFYIIHNEYLFKYIDYKSTLSKKDFETQFNNAALDIGYEIKNYETIKNYLENLNEVVDKENVYFNQIKEIYKKNSEEFSDKKTNNNKRIIKENFSSIDCIDLEMIKEIPTEINTDNNYITISKKDTIKNKLDVIEVLNNSIGFPGNTHEATIKENDISFLGEESLNIRIENLTKDNEMFSFENIILNSNDIENIKSITDYYQENIKWNSEHQLAKLKLKISFDNLKKMNEIVITPSISSDKDFLELLVDSIYVTDKQGNYQELIKEPINLYDIKSFIFNEQNVKEIIVNIIQNNGYNTKVGYLNYYYNSFEEGVNYTIPKNKKTHSISYLGMEYNKATKVLTYPSTFKSNKYSEEEIIEHFFTKPLDKEFEKCDIHLVNAQKFNINIDSIELNTNEFEETSVFISKNIYIEDEIKTLTIITDEYINTKEIIDDAFKYYITHNNGQEWVEINPINRFTNDNIIKLFYNNVSENSLSHVIQTEEPIHNIRIKVELKRVKENTVTPVLKEYQIIINE